MSFSKSVLFENDIARGKFGTLAQKKEEKSYRII